MDSIKNSLRKYTFQKELMQIVLTNQDGNSETQEKETLQRLYKLLDQESEKPELLNDIQGMLNGLEKAEQSLPSTLKAVFTDQFWDLFLCGTEVAGSCQRVDGDPSFNKGLLGYLMDGKNRLFAIKDAEGKIVARSIIRLLWNNYTQQPVLFQERIYSNTLDEKIIKAMQSLPQKLAQALCLPLFAQGEEKASICSLSSPSPWEYVDSANGIHKHGNYTIKQATLIQSVI